MKGTADNERPLSGVQRHPLDPQDASVTSAIRALAASTKGAQPRIEARIPFDALMESVEPRDDVNFAKDTVGGIPGLWVHPPKPRPEAAILHLHGGWFNFGTASAFRHFVGQIVARVKTSAFIPDYRLAPENPFPAATDDVWACYRGLKRAHRRIALAGDSAGGNLALGLASRVVIASPETISPLVGVAVLSPVTDLTLSGSTYRTRAEADPFFTRSQVAQLVHSYLGQADPHDALASPLYGRLAGLPPICIQVGDDEVLLDDSQLFLERAVGAGVDARLDLWMGMPHGFVINVGKLKAAGLALDVVSAFLFDKLNDPAISR
jgi:monoterpene epsilon-lactone hydrolase